jgi:hypothetical protein
MMACYEGEVADPCQLAGNQGCRVLAVMGGIGLFALDCGRFVLFPLCWVVWEIGEGGGLWMRLV